jgi:hypothetical protein
VRMLGVRRCKVRWCGWRGGGGGGWVVLALLCVSARIGRIGEKGFMKGSWFLTLCSRKVDRFRGNGWFLLVK